MSKKLTFKQRRETEDRIGKFLFLTAVLIAAIGISSLSFVSSAKAQTACAPRADVLEALTKGYTEQAKGMGLASNGNIVELFAGKDGASWTIVVTLPNGMSCPVFDGEGWEKLAIKVAGRVS